MKQLIAFLIIAAVSLYISPAFFILIAAIVLGVYYGGLAIGYAGGLGVLAMAGFCHISPGAIPIGVILIIASVIAAISAMQQAGGLDYLVHLAERALRSHPKMINILAPSVTYLLTLLAGTGHTAFSVMPVIIEVAKEQKIRPSLPLSLAVVASQIGITASPVSAAVVYLSGVLEPFGYSYLQMLGIWVASTYLAILIVSIIFGALMSRPLDSAAISAAASVSKKQITKQAKLSVLIFVLGVLAVVVYACMISGQKSPIISRDNAIIALMLSVATFITIIAKLDTGKIADSSVFKSGMSACVCVLGVAWLGDTFVHAHEQYIKDFAISLITKQPYLLAVAFFFASMLLYSQAATAQAIVPTIITALGVASHPEHAKIIIASFAAVSALFVLPTYPTLLGAVAMDDTGSTKIGRYIFNHSFFIPGLAMIVASVALGFLMVSFI